MKNLFLVSFNAVLQLLLVAMVGIWLARKHILTPCARKALAEIILWVMLPALLISSLSKEANPHNVELYFGIMMAAPIFVLLGSITGKLLSVVLNVPGDLSRLAITASTYGNSSYIPLPFLAVICLTAPFIRQSPELAKNASVTYISLYLMSYSPILWLTGFPYLSGKGIRQIKLQQIVNPPLIASAIGIIIAFTPPLRNLFHAQNAPFAVIISTLDMLAKGVFPCALLLLGANLAGNRFRPQATANPDYQPLHIPKRAYFMVILGKLVLMPLFGFAYTALAWKSGLIPPDPLVALVILIEAAVPPANNLIIMCQAHDKGETQMARLLFVAYCVSVVTLTLWTTFFLRSVTQWK